LEEALDIEWAHAMAPNAKIFLIEAASNSLYDLTWAEAWAGYYVDINGGGQVSNSWGSGEFSTETSYDYFFNNYSGNYKPVVYLASSGDGGTVEYPSASPFVVSVGGTTINRDASGNFLSETCWTGTGRGVSTVEAIPSYQSSIGGLSGTKRSTTDISFDADPASGVWVYDALNGGWFVVGGTSLSAPAMAGIMNSAGNHMSTTFQENNLLYSEFVGKATKSADFYDPTPAGYDVCTGIGTPRTLIGK
jgi:subtilase family serine protease